MNFWEFIRLANLTEAFSSGAGFFQTGDPVGAAASVLMGLGVLAVVIGMFSETRRNQWAGRATVLAFLALLAGFYGTYDAYRKTCEDLVPLPLSSQVYEQAATHAVAMTLFPLLGFIIISFGATSLALRSTRSRAK